MQAVNPGVRIERAQTQDIDKMLDLWKSIPGMGIGQGDEVDLLRAFINRNPFTCLLLKDKQSVIGTVLGGFDGRRGYIYHLAVHPNFQGQGYGRELLVHVARELEKQGALKIHLMAFNNNHNAAQFYQSQGWELRQDVKIFSWKAKK